MGKRDERNIVKNRLEESRKIKYNKKRKIKYSNTENEGGEGGGTLVIRVFTVRAGSACSKK